MSFTVKCWQKFPDGQLVPVCRPTDILVTKDERCCGDNYIFNGRNFTRKCDYIKTKENTLKLCWKYFAAGYQFYCLNRGARSSEKDHLLNLEKFSFSFKDLNKPDHQIKTFELDTDHKISGMTPEYDYVCDRTGFALLYYSRDHILQLYYYDFKRKFTTDIKVPFRLSIYIFAKLCNRTLWIRTDGLDINFYAVVIKDSNIWYSIQSRICPGVKMVDHVKSNSTFVCLEDTQYGGYFLLLYINLNSLAPNCLNYVSFDKVTRPVVFASCGTAIVDLSEHRKVLCMYIPEGILQFLYFERKEIVSVKWLKLGHCLSTSRISQEPWSYFVPELAIMVVLTFKKTLVIINVKECKVTRILDLRTITNPLDILFKFSEKFQKLTLTLPRWYGTSHKNKIIWTFDLCNKLWSLKTLTIDFVKKYYTVNDIRRLSLPLSLKEEIVASYGMNY